MTTIISILNFTFVIGVLIQFIKLGDLILRPHQQKKIQELAESFVLRLEYVKPMEWFKSLIKRGWVFWFNYCTSSAMMYVSIEYFFENIKKSHGIYNNLVIAVTTLSMILGTLFIFHKYGHKLFIWLYSESRFKLFIVRYIYIILAYFLIMALGCLVVYYLQLCILNSGYFIVRFLFMSLLLFFTLLFAVYGTTSCVVICAAGYVLNFYFFLLILTIILKFLRAIVWRIVEYNTGAWAAYTLLATVAIGIIKFLIRPPGE